MGWTNKKKGYSMLLWWGGKEKKMMLIIFVIINFCMCCYRSKYKDIIGRFSYKGNDDIISNSTINERRSLIKTNIEFQVFIEDSVNFRHENYDVFDILSSVLKITPIAIDVDLRNCPRLDESTFKFNGHFSVFIKNAPDNDYVCKKGDVIAYSENCIECPDNKRPLTGVIYLCNNYIIDKGVIYHEMLHLLGFSSDKFDNYLISERVDSHSDFKIELYKSRSKMVYKPFENVRQRKDKPLGKSGIRPHYFAGKTSVEYVRTFFNCDTIRGIELSKDGSHLSKYIYPESIMSESYLEESVIPEELSLKMLEASGWYEVDWEYFHNNYGGDERKKLWMEGIGCEVHNMNCMDYWKKYGDTQEFFSFSNFENSAFTHWESIPEKFQYSKDPHFGGVMGESMEYCLYNKKKWNFLV